MAKADVIGIISDEQAEVLHRMREVATAKTLVAGTDILNEFKKNVAPNSNEFCAGAFFLFSVMVVHAVKLMVITGGDPKKMEKQERQDTELFALLYSYQVLRAMDDPHGSPVKMETRAAEDFQKLTGREFKINRPMN